MTNRNKKTNKVDEVVTTLSEVEIEKLIKDEVSRQLSVISRCNSFTKY